MPSFAALLSASFVEVGGDECPFLGSFGLDEFFEEEVFFRSPGSFGFLFVFSDGFGLDIRLKDDRLLKSRMLIGMVGLKILVLFLWGGLRGGEGIGRLDFDNPGRMARLGGMVHGY